FTYTRALRANALALYNRPQDKDVLSSDVEYLVSSQMDGAYGYGLSVIESLGGNVVGRPVQPRLGRGQAPLSPGGPHWWDNSNSQYGLLGVWAGADAGIEILGSYWEKVRDHWVKSQLSDGEWSYRPREGATPTMTAAGTASLFVVDEYLDRDRPKS